MENNVEFVDLKSIADKYGRPYITLKKMAQRGVIPAFKFGRKWVVSPSEMAEWIETQKTR